MFYDFEKGLYIGSKVKDEFKHKLKSECLKHFRNQEFNFNEDLHTTIIYSDKPFIGELDEGFDTFFTTTGKLDKFGKDGEILVLRLKSNYLHTRHNELMEEHGLKWDFPSYEPHVTLSYDAKDIDITNINMAGMLIEFGPEEITEI